MKQFPLSYVKIEAQNIKKEKKRMLSEITQLLKQVQE